MSTTNGRVRKNKVQEFVPPSDGQDGELASFINSLIDQNAELAGKLENIDSLTELAEKTVIEAGKEAEEIKKEAEREANARVASIVARAEESLQEKLSLAQQQAQEIMKAAEEKSSLIIAEALNKAEAEALLIRKEAEQLRESSQKTEQCQVGRNPWDVPDELFMEHVVAQEAKAASTAENKSPEPPVAEAAVSAPQEASAEKPAEPLSSGKVEEDRKESPVSYDGIVDLALLPPIALDQMLKLHKHLKKNSRVKVVELKGSLDKGVTIKILVQAHTPLLNMLAVLPEVEKVSDEPIEVGKISSAHRKGDGPRPRTIAIAMKK